MRKEHILTTMAFFALTNGAHAQEVIGRNPSVSLLMSENGLSQQEAQMRIDLQDQIIAMSDKLNTKMIQLMLIFIFSMNLYTRLLFLSLTRKIERHFLINLIRKFDAMCN